MITITCNPYEKRDFIKYLEYAKEKKSEELEKKKINREMYDYEVGLINKLINRVNGNNTEDYLLNSKVFRESNGKGKKEDKTGEEIHTKLRII